MAVETICIITFPLSQAGYIPLSNLVSLCSRLARKVYLISGGSALDNLNLDANVQTFRVDHKVDSQLLIRAMNYVITQLKILCRVFIVSKKVDLVVFFLGGEGLFIPILAMKLMKKKLLLMPGGISTRVYDVKKDPFSKLISLLTRINFAFADKLIVYSPALANDATFTKHQRKLIIMHRHFVDFSKFGVKRKIGERLNLVGYLGRLSEEKGILNFVEAISLILNKEKHIYFVICGDGDLADTVDKIIKSRGLETHVKLTRWLPHDDVPMYLNELRLILLPSFTEGLPNILLEAMACGTPALANSVGAIPDIIKNCENGFLLDSNGPQHIADKILELLHKPELLKKVSENAYRQVRENFSEEKTIKTWQKILTKFGTPKDLTKA